MRSSGLVPRWYDVQVGFMEGRGFVLTKKYLAMLHPPRGLTFEHPSPAGTMALALFGVCEQFPVDAEVQEKIPKHPEDT